MKKTWDLNIVNNKLYINNDININNCNLYNIVINNDEIIIKIKNENIDGDNYDSDDLDIKDTESKLKTLYINDDSLSGLENDCGDERCNEHSDECYNECGDERCNEHSDERGDERCNENDNNGLKSELDSKYDIYNLKKCDIKIDINDDNMIENLKGGDYLLVYNVKDENVIDLIDNKIIKFNKDTVLICSYLNGYKSDKNQFIYILHRIYEILKLKTVKKHSLFKNKLVDIKSYKGLLKIEYNVTDTIKEIINFMNICSEQVKIILIIDNIEYNKNKYGMIMYNYPGCLGDDE